MFGEFYSVFESSNARYIDPRVLSNDFVWTDSFSRLISNTNHVILGARGSGKTMMAKMLSHNHLSLVEDRKAEKIIKDKSFIGIYLPLRVEWISAVIKNSWKSEEEEIKQFCWCLNLAACSRLIPTLRSCVRSYYNKSEDAVLVEKKICIELSKIWGQSRRTTFESVEDLLSEIEYKKNLVVAKIKMGIKPLKKELEIGSVFSMELFTPLKKAIRGVSKIMKVPRECTWALCIDEAEFLEEKHQVILNTYMRSFSEIVFKITTSPHGHYTLKTNTTKSLSVGHDFKYVYIDQLSTIWLHHMKAKKIMTDFAIDVFKKRISKTNIFKTGASLTMFFGHSRLLSGGKSEVSDHTLMKYIKVFGNEKMKRRAQDLYKTKRFDDEIARKIRGALLLKYEYSLLKGNKDLDLYSGVEMIVACSDGNPRRLLNILNQLSLSITATSSGFKNLEEKEQSRILRLYASSLLDELKIEAEHGQLAFDLMNSIGDFLREKFHAEKISTDLYFSIEYDVKDEKLWKAVELCVELGILYPILTKNEQDKVPRESGKYRLCNALSPYFYLMPRKGETVKLSTIINPN